MTTIYLFEDEFCRDLEPLISTTPPWDLLIGSGSLASMIPQTYPNTTLIATRQETTLEPGHYLFVNGRTLFPRRLATTVPLQGEDMVFLSDDQVAAMRITLKEPLSGNINKFITEKRKTLPNCEETIPLGRYLWHYIYSNRERLEEDAANLDMGVFHTKISERVALVEPARIVVGRNCKIAPGVVLDASDGPIIIGNRVSIMANSVILGPVFLDDGATVNPLCLIRPDTSIGLRCKVGGEINGSIVMPYSNKQHYGYLGRSYVGSWCNLAAGSVTSNVKNTYGNVSLQLRGEKVETGQRSLGSALGSYTMLGTNCTLPPGAIIGAFSSIFAAGSVPSNLPPFSWWDANQQKGQSYDIEKAIVVAKKAMARREQELEVEGEQTLRAVFAATKKDRADMFRN